MNSPVTRLKSPVSEIDLLAWVDVAEPSARLEYHRGFLGIDVMPGMSTLNDKDRKRLAALARAAFRTCEAGLVHLVQERIDTDRFAYIAIARPRPKSTSTAASLSALLLDRAA